ATSSVVQHRPPTAERFASAFVELVSERESAPRSSRRLMTAMLGVQQRSNPSSWSWTVRQLPQADTVIRSAAWDADGRCFAMTNVGARFWNGEVWRDAASLRLPLTTRFVQRCEAGGWLVGGAGNQLLLCNADGIDERMLLPEPVDVLGASGRMDGLLVACARGQSGPPLLFCWNAGRWLEPLALDGVAHLAPLLRVDEERWLIGGRLEAGGGFVAEYLPKQRVARVMPSPVNRAFMAGASLFERGVGFMVGSHGLIWRVSGDGAEKSVVRGDPDLSAAAIDILDQEWTASLGTLWARAPAIDAEW